MMEQKAIQAVCQEVYRRFPEVKGANPKVKLQAPAGVKSAASSATYLLVFQSRAVLADRNVLPRLVRVVANERGKILKISTSR